MISSGSIDKAFGLTFTSEMETCSVVEELNRTLVRLSLAVPPNVPLLVKTASGLVFHGSHVRLHRAHEESMS